MAKTPLAWCNLTHDPVRFLLYILGVAFAVILMFVQLGFRNALLDSNTQLHDKLRADLVLVSPNRQTLAMQETFSRRRLDQARSVSGVLDVHAMYLDSGIGLLRDTNPDPELRMQSRGVRVIGVDPAAGLLDLPELAPDAAEARSLETPGTALFDRRTKLDPDRPGQTIFGRFAPGSITELSGRRLELTGSFELGTDFTSDGTLIVGEQTFLDALRRPYTMPGQMASDRIDLGVVRLSPGADSKAVQRELIATLDPGGKSPDVDVLTLDELRERERTFWLNNTPIGFAFGFGLFMGFAVGMVICYQILSGDVADHLAEYATLKAIGYGNGYLARVVLQEAIILALFGFVVGGAVSWVSYEVLTATTGLPMRMTPDRALAILLATLAMCCASALLALVHLLRADPADVF